MNKLNENPKTTSLFDLYNVTPFGYSVDGIRKLSSHDNQIFENKHIKGSSSNVIEYSPNIGPSFTGPFNKGTIDSNSGTALMDFIKTENFIDKCGQYMCDSYRTFATTALVVLLVSIILYKIYM